MGFVVTAPSTSTISAEWTSYCEFNSDDDQTPDDHGTVAGISSVTGYPRFAVVVESNSIMVTELAT